MSGVQEGVFRFYTTQKYSDSAKTHEQRKNGSFLKIYSPSNACNTDTANAAPHVHNTVTGYTVCYWCPLGRMRAIIPRKE